MNVFPLKALHFPLFITEDTEFKAKETVDTLSSNAIGCGATEHQEMEESVI